jgi:hypothetical protein
MEESLNILLVAKSAGKMDIVGAQKMVLQREPQKQIFSTIFCPLVSYPSFSLRKKLTETGVPLLQAGHESWKAFSPKQTIRPTNIVLIFPSPSVLELAIKTFSHLTRKTDF